MDWLESMCHQDGELLGVNMAQQSSIVAGAAADATEIASLPDLLPRASIFSSNNSMATIPGKSKPPCYPKKKTSSNLNFEPKANGKELAGEEKIIRSKSKTLFHTLAERKRRLELAHKFTELSAIIPRSKKVINSTNYFKLNFYPLALINTFQCFDLNYIHILNQIKTNVFIKVLLYYLFRI